MKKMGVVLLLIIMLVLTGCGEKEILCATNYGENEALEISQKYLDENYFGYNLKNIELSRCTGIEASMVGIVYEKDEEIGIVYFNGISGEISYYAIPLKEYDYDNEEAI